MYTKGQDDALRLGLPSRPHATPNYDYLKEFAIHVAMMKFSEAIEIIEKHNYVEEFWLDREQMPENMFNWSFDGCITRLKHSTISYDLVLTVCKATTLEKKKTIVDLKEIKKYMRLFVHNYLNRGNNVQLMKSLHFFDAYIYFKEKLEFEKDRNINIYTGDQLAFMRTKIDGKKLQDPNRKAAFADLRTEQTVMESTQMRYRLRFYNSYADALEISTLQLDEHMTNELKQQLKTVDAATYCFQSSLSMYFNEIQTLKDRIHAMTQQFAKEDEFMVNKLLETKRKLEKLQTARTYYTEELERFRRAKQRMLQLDEMERLKPMKKAKRYSRKQKSSGSVANKFGRIKSIG